MDWPSDYPQNTGKTLCKFPSQQLNQSLSPKLSYARSHVSVCDIVRLWLLRIHSLQVNLCASKHMALIYDPGAKEQRYFKLATILLTLIGLLCSHSNKLDEKFLMLQAIQSAGLHFMIQSPAKQLKSAFV